MGHHQSNLEPSEQVIAACHPVRLGRRQAEPVHAGVNVQGGGQGLSQFAAIGAPFLNLLRRPQYRTQPSLVQVTFGSPSSGR